MAVYTRIHSGELASSLARFSLALVSGPEPVADGVENTTYFFTARREGGNGARAYVLSIPELADRKQIAFSAALTARLTDCGLPVPAPLEDNTGERVFELARKPALVFPRVRGQHPEPVTAEHCRQIGRFMAGAHLAGRRWVEEHPHSNPRGLAWLADAGRMLESRLGRGDNALLREQIQRYRRVDEAALPAGAIHGDLFRDNALFDRDELMGVIDFYQACEDWLLLDVAIAVNDWAAERGGGLNRERASALLSAYHQIRPFTRAERQYWQDVLCFACTRFWVSRLLALDAPDEPEHAAIAKDPEEFRERLEERLVRFPSLPGH